MLLEENGKQHVVRKLPTTKKIKQLTLHSTMKEKVYPIPNIPTGRTMGLRKDEVT